MHGHINVNGFLYTTPRIRDWTGSNTTSGRTWKVSSFS